MLKIRYLVLGHKNTQVRGTFFTEHEANLAAFALSEREGEEYSVAQITAKTELKDTGWKLYKLDKNEILFVQCVKLSEYDPGKAG